MPDMPDFIEPDEIPPALITNLALWFSEHNVAVCEEGDGETLIFDSPSTLENLAVALIQHGPVGVRWPREWGEQ